MKYVKPKYAKMVVQRTYPEAKNITITQGYRNVWHTFASPPVAETKTLNDLPALYDLKFTAVQLKLTDRYGTERHPDYQMNEFLKEFVWEPGDRFKMDINQGLRDATVLAVIGKEALIEYEMPAGSTALRIVHADHPKPGLIRNIAYKTCPKKWLQAMEEAGTTWICEPQ